MCQRVENKLDKSSRAFHLSEILKGLVVWACQDSRSKVKDKWLHLVPPTTKKEAQRLVGLLGFGGSIFPPFECVTLAPLPSDPKMSYF